MTNDQKNQIHRFLTYVGFIFMASAFLLPWLFIYQQNSVLISKEDFNNLTASSKQLSTKIVDLNLFIIDTLPYLSGILFVVGLFIVIKGWRNWTRKAE